VGAEASGIQANCDRSGEIALKTVGMMNPNPGLLGQTQNPVNPLLGSAGLYGQLTPRGVVYPDVPVYGQYGQQALNMAGRPASAPRTGTPPSPLPALPPASQTGAPGGGPGGSGWLSALMLGSRLSDLTGVGVKDIYSRLTGGGTPAISSGLASSADAGAMAGVADTAAANEAALLGQAAPTLASGGALGGGLAASAEAGALGGVAGTQAATEAALLGQAAPTLATGASGGGAAAGGAAAGTSAAGLAAGLGIAALPLAIYAMGGFANDRPARNQLALQQSGLQQTQLSGGQRVLIRPDGSFVPFNDKLMDDIRERWGVSSTEDFWKWMNSQPAVQGNINRVNGRQLPRGGNARSED
jgi:hypothetical protein